MRDAPPSFCALRCGSCQVLFRSPRNHRRHRLDSQLGSLLDSPLHVIELVDGYHQRKGKRRLGCELGDQVEANLIAPDRGHLRMKDVAAGHHVGLHARLRAQHAGHVLGYPSAACHGYPLGSLRVSVYSFSQKHIRGTLEAFP